jgi:head-tail adaptor
MTGAGKYTHRVRFDVQVEVPIEGGGTGFEWSTAETGSVTRWAAIEYLKGGEEVMSQRLQSIQPALIRVKLDTSTLTITPAWRAILVDGGTDGTTFALKSVADMEGQRRELTILAEAGAADA